MRNLTIVFDLDGTLIDSAPDILNAARFALEKNGHAPGDLSALRARVGLGARAVLMGAFELMDDRAAAQTPPPAGVQRRPDDAHVDAVLDDLLAHYEANIAVETTLYPGAAIVLARLKEIGCRIAICTNKREKLARLVLHELDVDQYLHAIVGRDTLPVHKPDPGHLIGSIILADGNPNRAILVGDSRTDVDTARRAGLPIIGVTFGYSAEPMATLKPDQVISGFGELEGAIQKVLHLLH